mgnify:FL=1
MCITNIQGCTVYTWKMFGRASPQLDLEVCAGFDTLDNAIIDLKELLFSMLLASNDIMLLVMLY